MRLQNCETRLLVLLLLTVSLHGTTFSDWMEFHEI